MTRASVLLALLCAGGCDFLSTGDADDSNGSGITSQGGYEPAIDPTGNDVDVEIQENGVCECPLDDAGIYMLSDQGEIWTFDPRTGCFAFVSRVDCGGPSDYLSLAVSRHGRAWVVFHGGDMYTVDLDDPQGSCLDPQYTDDDALFGAANMAFVREGPDDGCDRMYLYNATSEADHGTLAVMDPRSLELSPLASDDNFTYGDVTGTPDGRMFGLVRHPWAPRIREWDKHTGEILAEARIPELDDLWTGSITYWGGYFYIYASPDDEGADPNEPNVTRWLLEYDYFNVRGRGQVVTLVVDQLPFSPVGTAVSPCAPASAGDPRAVIPGCTKL